MNVKCSENRTLDEFCSSLNPYAMTEILGTLTWCYKCDKPTHCAVLSDAESGINTYVHHRPRSRTRQCSECGDVFPTLEINWYEWSKLMKMKETIEKLEASLNKVKEVSEQALTIDKGF